MGNGSEICEKLLKLRGPGAGGNFKRETPLVTGSTSSLISQLGSLWQDKDNPDQEAEQICLPSSHQVLTPSGNYFTLRTC